MGAALVATYDAAVAKNRIQSVLNASTRMAAMVMVASMLTSAGCASVGEQQSVAEYLDDAAITKRVEARLARDKAVAAITVVVETIGRVVHLKGTVSSNTERAEIETLARKTQGVQDVRNSITVRP